MTQTALSIDFLRAYAHIPRKAQRKLDGFIEKFREAPTSPAIHYEPIQGARDEQLRSVRIGDDYRAILRAPEQGDVFVLLWVDHHDEAYRWARNKQTAVHPVTGTLQVFDVPSGAQAALPSAPISAADTSAEPGEEPAKLFEAFSDVELYQGGVPVALLPAVRAVVSDEDLERLLPHLPDEAGEVLTGLAAGLELEAVLEEVLGRPPAATPQAVELPTVDPNDVAAALARETSQRKFRVLDADFDLEAALRWPLDVWRVFLHPRQKSIVQARTKGPMRVLGAAGTGKTVVALHRVAFLAKQVCAAPDDRILLTTFTRNLAADLRGMLAKLLDEAALRRVEVINLDAWAAALLSKEGRGPRLASTEDRERAWNRAIDLYGEDGVRREFYVNEWEDVVLDQDLRSEDEYVRCRRLRRGTRLSRTERRRHWPVFERYRTELEDRGLAEPVDVLRAARKLVEAAPERFRYSAVVVDETQDLSAEALRLLRALAGPEHADDVFLVGDAHQRIYGRPVSLSACGINVRGRRSRYLRLNYRTTAAISRWSITALRGESYDDLDEGTVDLRGYVSLREGQPPLVAHFEGSSDEQRFIAEEVRKVLESGIPPEAVCVCARTHSQLRSSYGPALEQAGVAYEEIAHEEPGPGRVRLATMHRIKGLEFSVVFVAGVNEGLVPLRTPELSSDDPVVTRLSLLRERCLLYVAASRARDRLVVTSYGKRSRFLDVAAESPRAVPAPRPSTPAPPSVAPPSRAGVVGPRLERADRRLDELPFPTRIQSWVASKAVATLRDLVGWTPEQLLREPNVGRTSVAEARKVLEAELGTSWEAARVALAPPPDPGAERTTEPSVPSSDRKPRWNELRGALKPSVLDAALADVELPTRLATYAASQRLTTVRELVAVSANDLIAAKNLGRASVQQGRDAVLAFADAEGQAAETLERGFFASWKEQLGALEPLPRMVLTNRSGLAGSSQTLQVIGELLGVTRERVRQIEATAIDRLRAKRRWIAYVRERLDAALVGRAVLLSDLDADAWWSGVEKRAEALDYFCEKLLGGELNVVTIEDSPLVAKATQGAVDSAWSTLRREAAKLQLPAPELELMALVEPVRSTLGEAIAEKMWERLQSEVIVGEAEAGQRQVLSVGDSKTSQVLAFLRSCDQPVSVHEVYEKFGRVHFPDEVLFFRAGLVGVQQHFPDFETWQTRLVPIAVEIMQREGPDRQWSVAELFEDISEIEPLPDWLGHWHLASLLRQGNAIRYLGRLRVALPGGSDESGRIHVKEALRSVLDQGGGPMARRDLLTSARDRAGASETTLGLAVSKLPFVRLSGDRVGLLDRDLPGGTDSVLTLTDRLEGWLTERNEGATSFEILRQLEAWGIPTQDWCDETVLSVVRSDPRFRLSQSGNVGLADWDSVRVPSRLKILEDLLGASTGRVAVDEIQRAIEARYGKPVDRATLAGMANRVGAGLAGEWVEGRVH